MANKLRSHIGYVVVAVAAFMAVSAVAVAVIPDPGTGAIHACYVPAGTSTDRGAILRIIDPDQVASCRRGWKSLTFNQQSPSSLSGYEIVRDPAVGPGPGIPTSGTLRKTVPCPVGKQVISGGFESAEHSFLTVDASRPAPDGTGWLVFLRNDASTTSPSIELYAICVDGP
jgi:hypothetical protein